MRYFASMLVILMLMVSKGATAQSSPPEVALQLDTPQLQGKTTARYWGLKVYDAMLWTEREGRFDLNQKFALSLRYAYHFTADDLVNNSIRDIARVEGVKPARLKDLEKKLQGCMRDVNVGDRVTGVAENANQINLFYNGRKTCSLSYTQIRNRFFGIWLAPTSLDPRGAARLVGER